MVWLLKQPFSFYRRFKIHARLGLGLVGRVGAVTTLGRSALPRWYRVRALPRVAGRVCLWPGRGPAAVGLAA